MNDTTSNDMTGATASTRYSLWQLVRYMLALGTWGFGGPVALAGYMYRDLVERRGWISDSALLIQRVERRKAEREAQHLGGRINLRVFAPLKIASWFEYHSSHAER